MAATIARARVLADVVLIDTAPAGTVNDALSLVQLVDGTVIVARHGQTTRDHARRTARLFEQLDTEILGLVLTDVPATTSGYYGPQAYAAELTRATDPAGRRRVRSRA
jgi:non-specific protein-tyrosine kinase